MPTPSENRELSPYTGWTRGHWEATADELLLAVRPYASPRHGLINLPGPRPSSSGPRSDGLEGYARTFLLAALRIAGAHAADPPAGPYSGDPHPSDPYAADPHAARQSCDPNARDPYGHLARYAEGLAAGTARTQRSEAWPLTADVRQAIVESASVALSLRLTRPWLWDALDDRTRQRTVDWLLPALDPSPVDNNWWLFGLTVAGFLQDAGIETDRARRTVDRSLARIEEWYLGDGWYSDGANRAFDHYNGWALHFYPVLHAHLAADQGLLDRYGPRLHRHLDDATRLFGADGSPMPYGRSLTYRFAAAAAPWLGALTGHTPLAPGATRRLVSGTLRHFLDRGARDERGLLSLGWHGPYEPVLQSYSGPGSPYWAAKGFLGLLIPPGHPVWTDREEPLPAETADAVTLVGPPHMLVQSTAADGVVRLHNHGSNHAVYDEDARYYSRFAYSTRTGPTTHEALADNHFALVVDDVETERGPAVPLGSGPGWLASAHTPHPGVRVVSATLALGRVEVRAHLVAGAPEGTPVRQTGWATDEHGPTAQLHPVHGYSSTRVYETGSTPLARRTRTAALEGRTAGDPALFVALASLTAEPDPAPLDTLAEVEFEVEADVEAGGAYSCAVRVRWPDGSCHTLTADRTSGLSWT
ncbi:DUF2264 domain-containing protein [Streptomyces sp. NPDC051907]|uniref:DUF2264 domain-containing protein n=1 Tax=Streptomyces sp. NPDC051907 TaxID=3155284 RepID=UPI00343380BD